MALASSIFWAGLILSLKREEKGERRPPWPGATSWPSRRSFRSSPSDLSLSPRSAAILAFLGVFQLACAYVLFVKGLKLVTATQASLIGMVEPIANPVWVFLFVGERPSVLRASRAARSSLGAIAWQHARRGARGARSRSSD